MGRFWLAVATSSVLLLQRTLARRCTWEEEDDSGITYTSDPWAFSIESSCEQIMAASIGALRLGDLGAEALAAALAALPRVTALDVQGNEIRDAGAVALAKALETHSWLQSLGIAGNQIGTEGAKALAKAVQHSIALEFIDAGFNRFGHEGWAALADAAAYVEKSRDAKAGARQGMVDIFGIDGGVLASARLKIQSLPMSNPPSHSHSQGVPSAAGGKPSDLQKVLAFLQHRCAEALAVAKTGHYVEDFLLVLGISDLASLKALEPDDVDIGLQEAKVPVLPRRQLRRCFVDIAASTDDVQEL